MVRVLHYISSLKRGGRERQICIIVNNSGERNIKAKIIYLNERSPNYIEEYDLTYKLLKIKSTGFLSRLIELHKLLKKEKPNIVYTWGNLESIFILLLSPYHKFKFINGSIRHGIRSKEFWHYFRTFVLHLSPNIVANSKAGLKAEKLSRGYVLYNGIENKFIGMISKEKKKDKRKKMFNVEDKTLFFISVANLVPYKDYFSIIEALKKIKEKGYNFFYLILGEGPLRTRIEQRINENGLTSNIKISGNVENVNEYLQLADVFIHSSKGEGCSNAILEAMGAGLPIIATNTGGTSEIILNENGFLFEYQNVDQLSKIIIKCFDNSSMLEMMGKNSFKTVNEKFTVNQMMNNYESILNSVISNEKK